MENETKQTEHVKDARITIRAIEFEVGKSRLVITTDIGKITCKCFKEGINYIRGIKVIDTKTPMEATDLPEKVFSIQEKANRNGSVIVIGSYNIMTTEKDGQEQKYRFINLGMFDKWVEETNVPQGTYTPPKVTDVVIPTGDKERAYNNFMHKKEVLKNRLELGTIDLDDYEEMVRKLKKDLLKE